MGTIYYSPASKIRFGVVIAQDLRIHFCEPIKSDGTPTSPDHSVLISRLGWPNNEHDGRLRWFVRVEVLQWLMCNFRWDDPNGLPEWVGMWEDEIKERVEKVMQRVEPLFERYQIERLKDKTDAGYKKLKDDFIKDLRQIPEYIPPDYKIPKE
jgi:hypothetical protein